MIVKLDIVTDYINGENISKYKDSWFFKEKGLVGLEEVFISGYCGFATKAGRG